MEKQLLDGISVIICCYNSGWIIHRCLEALKAQQVREGLQWEVVLVDNNCTDDTATKAISAMANTSVDFRIVQEYCPGLLNVRKKGIKEVKYKYTIYCDDDNLLSQDYVDTMYGILNKNPRIGAAGGKGVAEFTTDPDPIVHDYIGAYAVGSQLEHSNYLYGAGLSTRTELVRRIYSEQTMFLTGRLGGKLLGGDDTELTAAIRIRGYELYATDNVSYRHVLKSDRLTYEYLTRMLDGFREYGPVINIIEGVICNNMWKYFWRPFFVCIFVVVKYSLLFNVKNAKSLRNGHKVALLAYFHWGIFRLYKVYNVWSKIKSEVSKEGK